MQHNHEIQNSISLWFSVWQVEVLSKFVNTLHDSASFQELSSLIELKYFHLPSNFMINIFTLTDNVLELKVNLEKYIFYMHYSVYSKLLAAQIFPDICEYLRLLAHLIVNKLRATDSNISADK